jgi:acetyltransferase-like isoleucine patch superfamily enzyme
MNFGLAARFMTNAPAALIELLRTQVIDHTIERRKLAACGPDCYIPCSTSMRFAERIHLGARVIVGPHNRLWASKNAVIEIGDDVLFGPGVTLLTATHATDNPGLAISAQGSIESDVRIGRGAWLGANTVVMPGVEIGIGAVVGAGAIVTRSVEAHTVVAGVPARPLRSL